MGLLDWLTSDIGSMGGGPSPGAMSNPMGDMTGVNPMTAPPIAPPAAPPALPPPSGDMPPASMAPPPPSGDMPPASMAPPPLPPPGGDTINVSPLTKSYSSDGSALPPNATSTMGTGMAPVDPNGAGSATGILGRALGMDVNRERSFKGSLAAGLKSVGENANKPGLAAFAGSAGSGIEGGQKAETQTTAEQSKYLNDAIRAQAAGDAKGLNVARTKLALAQAKAVSEGKVGGKDSVMNTKEQLYLRGLGAVNQDVKVKASAANLKALATSAGVDSPEYKAAQKAHDALIDQTKESVFNSLGVDAKSMKEIGQKPGFSADKPVPAAGLTKDKFDALPPGSYFINPADGKLLVKKGAPQQQGATSMPAIPTSPPPITAPAGSTADTEE